MAVDAKGERAELNKQAGRVQDPHPEFGSCLSPSCSLMLLNPHLPSSPQDPPTICLSRRADSGKTPEGDGTRPRSVAAGTYSLR